MSPKTTFYLAIFAVGAFLVSFLAVGCIETIEGHEVGVIQTWDGVQDEVLLDGTHFINPFYTTVYVYDASEQLYNFGSKRKGEKIERDSGEILCKSSDAQKVWLSGTFRYRADKTKMPLIHKEARTDYESKWIEPTVTGVLKGLCEKHEAKAIYAGSRDEIRAAGFKVFRKHSALVKNGMVAEDLIIDLVRLEPDYEKVISDTMTAKEEAVLAIQQRKTAEEHALAVKAGAQANVQKMEQTARANRLAAEQVAQGEAYKVEAKAKAQLAAAKMQAEGIQVKGLAQAKAAAALREGKYAGPAGARRASVEIQTVQAKALSAAFPRLQHAGAHTLDTLLQRVGFSGTTK